MSESQSETVEVPIGVVRDAVDLLAGQAKAHYSANATKWGDRYHGTARQLHNVTDDGWTDVGETRYIDRAATDTGTDS